MNTKQGVAHSVSCLLASVRCDRISKVRAKSGERGFSMRLDESLGRRIRQAFAALPDDRQIFAFIGKKMKMRGELPF
ncbi:hypothetical protein [Novosphingobium sp.]|uniref:hypothetical protein n=1 Tax=Novosphingobium sp. TaxID=1874826 RepID=UPI003D13087C